MDEVTLSFTTAEVLDLIDACKMGNSSASVPHLYDVLAGKPSPPYYRGGTALEAMDRFKELGWKLAHALPEPWPDEVDNQLAYFDDMDD